VELPEVVPVEQEYLEVGEASRFLSAAQVGDRFWFAVFAFFLYTGCRNQELRSRLVEDVDFKNESIRFRPNDHYQLKSKHANRRVPLWPALRDVLQEYLGDRKKGLLFPSPTNGRMMAGNFGRSIRRVMAELEQRDQAIPKNVTPHTFRHTYTSVRVQTLDHGAPVSVFTVACELGHRDTGLIERVYGHLTKVPNRAETVEYVEADVLPMKEEATAGSG